MPWAFLRELVTPVRLVQVHRLNGAALAALALHGAGLLDHLANKHLADTAGCHDNVLIHGLR